jgi:hypothetical protein
MHIMAAQLKADLVLLTVSFKQHGLQWQLQLYLIEQQTKSTEHSPS